MIQHKPNSPKDTFYKRLGGATASLADEDEECIMAKHIIRHESVLRSKARVLNRDCETGIQRLFRNRISSKARWWPELIERVNNKNYEREVR